MRGVISEIFAEVSCTTLCTVTIPHKTEVGINVADEIVGWQESMKYYLRVILHLWQPASIAENMQLIRQRRLCHFKHKGILAHRQRTSIHNPHSSFLVPFFFRLTIRTVVEKAERTSRLAETVIYKPLSHHLVRRNDIIGIHQTSDLLLHRESLAAERAEIVNQRYCLGSTPACYATDEREIFLMRILQYNTISITHRTNITRDSRQIHEKSSDFVAMTCAFVGYIHRPHQRQGVLVVGLGLISRTVCAWVVF